MATCSTCGGTGQQTTGTSIVSCTVCGGLGYFEGGKGADDFAHGRSSAGSGCAVAAVMLGTGVTLGLGGSIHAIIRLFA